MQIYWKAECMRAIFISDAHLKFARDDRYKQLTNFLNDIKDGKACFLINSEDKDRKFCLIDDLYIVGDLFDFWYCEGENIYPEFRQIISKLIELQKSGVRIHLSEGNHDFFLREYFHDILGMDVYEEWAEVQLDELRA
jgi:UDP-2,3-diacylglucosamine hydrolase